MKTRNLFRLFSVTIVVLMLTACSANYGRIALQSPEPGTVLSQTKEDMLHFLKLADAERRKAFEDKAFRAKLYQQHQSVPNTFTWNATPKMASYTLEFAMDRDFTMPAQEMLVAQDDEKCTATVCNFQVGKTIYWRVKGIAQNGDTVMSPVGTFKTDGTLPRQITLPGVDNVRDLGGWAAADGKHMRQGIIFRSAGFNLDSPDWNWDKNKRIDPMKSRIGDTLVKQEGKDYFVKKVGIKTDLDLRWDGEVAIMKESPLGASVHWVHVSSMDYGNLFTPEGLSATSKNFKLFADKTNYPIVFHCIAGADRTGTLAFILQGLVGVKPDDLRKDWEVTARDYFSYVAFERIVHGFDAYGKPGDSLPVKIQNFLLSIGVSQAEIDAYKAIILE